MKSLTLKLAELVAANGFVAERDAGQRKRLVFISANLYDHMQRHFDMPTIEKVRRIKFVIVDEMPQSPPIEAPVVKAVTKGKHEHPFYHKGRW